MKKFMNWKTVWITITAVIIILGTYMATVANAGYTPTPCNSDYHCKPTPTPKCDKDWGKKDWDKCQTPTPTVTPTATPTPTDVPCYQAGAAVIINEDTDQFAVSGTPCETVTPTPTVSPSPTETPAPPSNTGNNSGVSGGGQSNQAPGPAVCNIPFQAPILQGFTANGNGSVTFSWWPSPGASKYSITYGYATDALVYGEDNIPSTSTSITLNGLIPGNNVWAQVQAWQGGCEESSNLFDPVVR